ncbi:Tetratricopeptide TPR_2 [Winogradskyella psychrotolerans RS-3]|uniref:Tetratricopeptide TPR_2 n=1 Tax=Winogradskyella psychrotolerans RS-3 TaxID=641526 RepID=S7VNV0_9FLAO|nr:tetratricopeptide repeat protein [Winogradskyella psychrotolerans]EPR71915.1 Tetratricopeptide TPR_2 [Winogradskyella psychrotolerans RS-3]
MYKRILCIVFPLLAFNCGDGLTYEQKLNEYQSYINITDSLINANNYEEAIKYANTAISLTDTLSPAFTKKGIACYELNWLEFAEENFDEAIEIEGEASKVYKRRALVHLKNNDSDFLDDINIYLLNYPEDEEALEIRRDYYENKEDYDEAIFEYDFAIEKYRDSTELYIKRSSLLYLNGDYERALEDYEKILVLDASNTEIYNKKNDLLAELHKKNDLIIFIILLFVCYGVYVLISYFIFKTISS